MFNNLLNQTKNSAENKLYFTVPTVLV